jgi:hypothetical protein
MKIKVQKGRNWGKEIRQMKRNPTQPNVEKKHEMENVTEV